MDIIFFIRYGISILSGIIIIVGLLSSVYILKELNPVIAAIGGLLFTIPLRFFWLSYMMPVLKIKGVETVWFNPGDHPDWRYLANRIIVENSGRSAAKNCKGYIDTGKRKERVCWMVPAERPNATINAHDEERLDFCAFYINGPTHLKLKVKTIGKDEGEMQEIPKIIAPTEEKWYNPWECRVLDGIEECKVLITADNADPVEETIRFNIEKKEIEIGDKQNE